MTAIDPDIAGQLARDLPPAVFRNILRTFETDLARLVTEMIEAAKTGETEAYRRAAHGLAGAAGAIGALELERLSRLAMDPRDTVPPAIMIRDIGAAAQAALAELVGLGKN
jgi:HPt (histidine-containing phosphotransfer) domain-containing protein